MQNITCIYLKTLSQQSGENPRSSLLIEYNNQNYILNLWEPWHEIGDYLPPYTKINVFNVEIVEDGESVFYSAGSQSIVVIDPDILMYASSVGNISYCPRSYYINDIVGELPSPYVAVRGTIVHVALSAAIASKSKPSLILPDVLNWFELNYEQLGYKKSDVHQDVKVMTESLDDFMDNFSDFSIPESLFLSPELGIRGRIDVLDKNQIYELKTAKVTNADQVRFSDSMQVSLYSYGIGNIRNTNTSQSGSVIYVGSGDVVSKQVNPSWGILRYSIQLRNLAYRISYLGYIPPILPEEQNKKCEKCSVRILCTLICAGLYQYRTCENCNNNIICSKKALPQKRQSARP